MIPQTKAEALAVLSEICELSPDVRLGQLFAHLGFLGEDQTDRSLWDIDDEQLLAVLYHHRSELVARFGDPCVAASTAADGQIPSVRKAGELVFS